MLEKEQIEESKKYRQIKNLEYILSEIRECPHIKKKDVKEEKKSLSLTLKGVLFPENEGVLTYYNELENPFNGFIHWESVEIVDETKKFVMKFFRNKILFIFFLFYSELILSAVNAHLKKIKNKPNRYCKFVRELYKNFKKGRENLRDFFCMFLEYDDIYRFISQDILSELNKDNVKRNVIKELLRLCNILEERDLKGIFKEKIKDVKKGIRLLYFSRRLRNEIREMLLGINLDNVKLDKGDKEIAILKASQEETNPYIWDRELV